MRCPSLVSGSYQPLQVVAVVVVGSLIVACSSASSSSRQSSVDTGNRMDIHASRSPSERGPEPGESFASPPASAIPAGTRVPDIRGMEFEDAVTALRTLGMDFGLVTARTDTAKLWVVLEQSPGPGDQPSLGGRVSMTVSMGPGGDGIAGVGGVACRPERDDIDEPYCLGKAFRY
ncbi:MAG: PASTA domain-containing protein [Actinobacteria bacterium]|nr:MAG: PASTA domain-containing protein [Actinomycetota bacterium]